MTVAFALLRKPLKENLFYFEWMLADRDGFMKEFRTNENTAVGRIPVDKKREIIGKAIGRTATPNSFNADTVFSLRYERGSEIGFEGLWDQANHLVTNFKAIQTEPQNFNFVFSRADEHLSQWHFLYSRLPYLLNYAVEIAEALFENIAKTDPAYAHSMRLRRHAGILIWLKSGRAAPATAADMGAILSRPIDVDCPRCSARIGFTDGVLQALYDDGKLQCDTCKMSVKLPYRS